MLSLYKIPCFRFVVENEYFCGNKPADIIVLLDSSNSIWGPNFQTQINFVKKVTSMFDIGANRTRVGVLTYNTDVKQEIGLGDYDDKLDLTTAIGDIKQREGYNTNTFQAIRHMRQNMFKKTFRERQNAAKIGIIVTDGQSSNVLLTIWEAAKTKQQGIRLFAIGIGVNTNERELQGIASKPESEHVFKIDNFEALESIRQILAVRTCEGISYMCEINSVV